MEGGLSVVSRYSQIHLPENGMHGKNIHFWFLHRNSSTSKCHSKSYTLFSAQGSEELGEPGLSSLLCLQVAELAASLGAGKPFQDRSLFRRPHRFHIPGRPFWAACPAPRNWPIPSPPPLVKGPAVPVALKQVPLCRADALILAQANEGKLHIIETIPVYLGFEAPGDITKASVDTALNCGLHPFIQIAVILCLLHARHSAAYYW